MLLSISIRSSRYSEFQEQDNKPQVHTTRRMEGIGRGGEIRRVHIIYFLSRMGRIEHPHLIRVNHVNRAGVHLKDVKRWLSDLRGKEMPDSFSWSYKRRYKTGYVWQDLMDDDLITPISDNEYVLKGSEISAFTLEPGVAVKKTDSIEKPAPVQEKPVQCNGGKDADISGKPIETECEEEDEESVKRSVFLKVEGERGEGEEDKDVKRESESAEESKGRVLDSLFGRRDDGLKKTKNDVKSHRNSTTGSSSSSSSKTKSSSQVLRNILTCGNVDTNDSAIRPIDRRSKLTSPAGTKVQICAGGSVRVFGGVWNQQQQQLLQDARKSCDGTSLSKKQVSAASKPHAEPICSQCGKAFNPEKLHAHMKSCKALKSRVGKGGQMATSCRSSSRRI